MLNENQINYIKATKTKKVTIIDNKTILGEDMYGGIFKVLYITNDNINLDVFHAGIDVNAYNKAKKNNLVDNIGLWSSMNIKSEHIRKLNKVETLKSLATEIKHKSLTHEEDQFFYHVLKSYRTADNGEFVDIFNDYNYIFIYPAMLNLTKNQLVDVTRYSISNNKLYQFTLKTPHYILDTYVLCVDL